MNNFVERNAAKQWDWLPEVYSIQRNDKNRPESLADISEWKPGFSLRSKKYTFLPALVRPTLGSDNLNHLRVEIVFLLVNAVKYSFLSAHRVFSVF